MNQLDDTQHILQLDKSNMHQAIKNLPLQLAQTWEESMQIELPDSYKNVSNIVVAGMGGSELGPGTVKALYFDKITKPIEIVNGYDIPGYADQNTLLVLSSNSGNTEEVLSCAEKGKASGCKMVGITTGGKLKEFLESNNLPGYIFNQRYNTTGQPRMSTGYMILSLLVFLMKLEFVDIDENEIKHAIDSMNQDEKLNGLEIDYIRNPAKQIAVRMHNHIPFLIGADFLSGIVHTIANQINENSKSLSTYFLIPEMNHHLLEGLGYENNKESIIFLIIESNLYPEKISQRFELTKTIIEKNNFDTIYPSIDGKTKVSQAFNLLQLGSYISFYMAMLNDIDPSPIPWVNFFKKELNEVNGH